MPERIKDLVRARLYGRPQKIVSQSDPHVRETGSWVQVAPARTEPRRPPRIFGRGELQFPVTELPEIGLFCFPNGRSTAHRGWTYDAAGTLVYETTWFGTALRTANLPKSFKAPVKLRGTCLSLLSEYGIGNYGHFLLDCISRIGIAKRAGWDPSDIDYFYCYRPNGPAARFMMARIGIDESKCIWANDVLSVVADQMLVTTFPGTGENYASIVPETLRTSFETITSKGRRLFIPRRGTRRLTNEAEIEAAAVEFEFEICDFQGVEDEFRYCREADYIVGPHGAGLSNLAVCRPGTKVLELTPSDHKLPYFYTLAEAANLDFSAILGTSTDHRPIGSTGPSPYDFSVDVNEFREALSSILD